MKIRKSFVSNSSSSSFVVDKDLTASGILCYKLQPAQLPLVSSTLGNVPLTSDKDWYLTEAITDGLYGTWLEARVGCEDYVYMDLQMCGEPYDPEFYTQVGDKVWLHTHDVPGGALTAGEVAEKLTQWFGAAAQFVPVRGDDGVVIYINGGSDDDDND